MLPARGLASFALEAASLPLLSDIVYATGYATMVFVVWYVWVRPIDFSNSAKQVDVWPDEEPEEDGSQDGTAAKSDDSGTAESA